MLCFDSIDLFFLVLFQSSYCMGHHSTSKKNNVFYTIMPYITYSISGEYHKDTCILCTYLLLHLFVKCDQNSVFNIDSSFSLEHMYSVRKCTYIYSC